MNENYTHGGFESVMMKNTHQQRFTVRLVL